MTNNNGARKRAGKGARTATCKFLKKSTGPNNSCNEVRNAQPSVEITRIVSKQYHHSWGKLKKPAQAALRNHVCVCAWASFLFLFFRRQSDPGLGAHAMVSRSAAETARRRQNTTMACALMAERVLCATPFVRTCVTEV